ncbi:MAG: AraC family transcriptional regulator [Clostridiales bacterium]|nr:AraC family transcriptional regulator [Clostridiales bacterium]
MNINFYYLDHLPTSAVFPIRISPEFEVGNSSMDLSMYPSDKVPEFQHQTQGPFVIRLRNPDASTAYDKVMPEHMELPEEFTLPQQLTFHMHKYCEITKITSGKVLYLADQKALTLKQGDLILFNNYIPHAWIDGPGKGFAEEISFTPEKVFTKDFFGAETDILDFMNFSVRYCVISAALPQNLPILKAFDRILQEYAKRQPGSQTIIKCCLLEMFAYIYRMELSKDKAETSCISVSNAIHPSVKLAIDYMEDHFQKNLTLIEVARECFITPTYLSALFKKHIGISFSQYLNRMRVEKSLKLICTTDTHVTDIAFQCGFLSVASFYRAFNNIYGISPLQMRKLNTKPRKEPAP